MLFFSSVKESFLWIFVEDVATAAKGFLSVPPFRQSTLSEWGYLQVHSDCPGFMTNIKCSVKPRPVTYISQDGSFALLLSNFTCTAAVRTVSAH